MRAGAFTQLWSQRKEADEARKQRPKMSPAQIRVQKGAPPTRAAADADLAELELPSTMRTFFPDPGNIMYFELVIVPDEGVYWRHQTLMQACTAAARSASASRSAPTIPTIHPRSSASKRWRGQRKALTADIPPEPGP